MNVLQAIDLKKYYGAEPNITSALDGVSFSVEQGEFVEIVGTSGSAKSTLLNRWAGWIRSRPAVSLSVGMNQRETWIPGPVPMYLDF